MPAFSQWARACTSESDGAPGTHGISLTAFAWISAMRAKYRCSFGRSISMPRQPIAQVWSESSRSSAGQPAA